MADQKHLEILKQGVADWNKWRKKHPGIAPDLNDAHLVQADLSGVNLSGVNLSGANLSGVNLSGADLATANLNNADLRLVNFSEANLRFADLGNANFASANLKRAFLTGSNLIGSDLSHADLSHADLSNINFSSANLHAATLTASNLNGANLSHADLSHADLSHADLRYANLTDSNLSNTNLSYADLRFVNLISSDLKDTSLTQAHAGWMIFANLNLQTAYGLDTLQHWGPSTVGVDTLLRSEGNIPTPFLRNVGFSETFIDYVRALTQNAIEYYTCFISYSSKDQAFADRLYADLQTNGVRCWFAPHDLRIGDKIRPRIDESIRLYDKLLLVLSEHSVKSHWVEHEVETALDRETEGSPNVLFPIRLDNTVMRSKTGWASHIRQTRHIGDFTLWKQHDNYQKALERLFRDLKEEKLLNEGR